MNDILDALSKLYGVGSRSEMTKLSLAPYRVCDTANLSISIMCMGVPGAQHEPAPGRFQILHLKRREPMEHWRLAHGQCPQCGRAFYALSQEVCE